MIWTVMTPISGVAFLMGESRTLFLRAEAHVVGLELSLHADFS